MKKVTLILVVAFLMSFLALESCGPVIVSHRPEYAPPPTWFYPNRIETVRYIYFPEYLMYYDLTMGQYIYYDTGTWITVNVLPPRYRNIDLRRARTVRITNYYSNNIAQYHNDSNRGRSNRTSRTTRRN